MSGWQVKSPSPQPHSRAAEARRSAGIFYTLSLLAFSSGFDLSIWREVAAFGVPTVSSFTLKLDKNAKNINSTMSWNPLSLSPNNPEKTLIIPPNVICVVTVATLDMGLSSALRSMVSVCGRRLPP
ncbi:hypothetical protein MUK42_19246 [Musa troglodytarum]|uniref:Uncharacterized protein n=1 Tax=Musa troglodytarum TaxID=320322 RepID=A0A9E7K153_9LILI|nr:hypothetical protein MUK42_19246 [Musa troglodytarum]